MSDIASFVNKFVDFKFCGAELRFELSHALFSSFDIDQGTRLLLKAVARDPVLAKARRVLDEGCGVGVIGLCIAKAFPDSEVTLRDRDSLALAFTDRNRLANRLKGVSAYTDPETKVQRLPKPAPSISWGLLADGREGGPYDFVLSNLPAKAGAPVLQAFFYHLSGKAGPQRPETTEEATVHETYPALLNPGGRAAVVIVNPLAEAAAAWIQEAQLKLVSETRGSGHKVYIVENQNPQPSSPALPEAKVLEPGKLESDGACPAFYQRVSGRFKLGDLSFRASGFWGLPEFDTPSFASSVAAEVLEKVSPRGRSALILNPGVGHLALWVCRQLGIQELTIAARDLLSLQACEANLESLPNRGKLGFKAVDALHAADLPPESFDLILDFPDIVPEYDWISPSWNLAEGLLKHGGSFLIACPPTEMNRFEKQRPTGLRPDSSLPRWREACQRRKKGSMAGLWIKG